MCVCLSVITVIRISHTLAKIKHVKMAFVDVDICHRLASMRGLYSVPLTFIFYFKCLKYVKFVYFCLFPERKKENIMKQNQQYTLKHVQSNGVTPVFLIGDIYQHFRFKMFKMSEIRSFSYVAGKPKL